MHDEEDGRDKATRIANIINDFIRPTLNLRMVENLTLDATIAIVTFGVETIVHYNPADMMCRSDVDITRAILLSIEHARLHNKTINALCPAPWFGTLIRGVA